MGEAVASAAISWDPPGYTRTPYPQKVVQSSTLDRADADTRPSFPLPLASSAPSSSSSRRPVLLSSSTFLTALFPAASSCRCRPLYRSNNKGLRRTPRYRSLDILSSILTKLDGLTKLSGGLPLRAVVVGRRDARRPVSPLRAPTASSGTCCCGSNNINRER